VRGGGREGREEVADPRLGFGTKSRGRWDGCMHVVLPVVAVLVGIVVVVLMEDGQGIHNGHRRGSLSRRLLAKTRGASFRLPSFFARTQPTHRITHTPHRSASEGAGVAGLVQPLGPQDHSYAGEIWNLRPKVRGSSYIRVGEVPSLPS